MLEVTRVWVLTLCDQHTGPRVRMSFLGPGPAWGGAVASLSSHPHPLPPDRGSLWSLPTMFLWQNKNTHACLLPGALGQELGGPSVFDPWRPLIREHRGKWRHRLGEQWGPLEPSYLPVPPNGVWELCSASCLHSAEKLPAVFMICCLGNNLIAVLGI